MKNRKLKIILILIVLFSSGFFIYSDNQSDKKSNQLYIGILETKHSNWPEYSNRDDSIKKKIVRVVFYKLNNEWRSFQNEIDNNRLYPLNVSWIITFDGKKIGNFKSEATPKRFNASWTFPRDSYHKPISNNLPTIGKSTTEFAGWPPYILNPRPLVLVSQEYYRDPENWKPYSPKDSQIKKLYPNYENYLTNNHHDVEIISRNFVNLKSYKSNQGNYLIQLGIMQMINQELHPTLNTWYFISADGIIINISSMVDAKYKEDEYDGDNDSILKLVDAGDYDGDQKSEIIFWAERYNGDGYIIFYDNFKSFAEFSWKYH